MTAVVRRSRQPAKYEDTIADFGNGKVIEKFNYPVTLVPFKQGGDYIGNSPSDSDSIQLITDIKNYWWTVFQQKTNGTFTT